MIRRDIWRFDQLIEATRDGASVRNVDIAVTLYPVVADSTHPDRSRLLEEILVNFSTGNGIFKRTQSHRFEAFDTKVIELLRERRQYNLNVHDIAVSDGRSAVQFFERLKVLEGTKLRFLATDRTPEVTAISSSVRSLEVVIDPISGTLLQVIRPPFVFNSQARGRRQYLYLVKILFAKAMRSRVKSLLEDAASHGSDVVQSPVRLLSPECLHLLNTDSRFRFESYSIFEPAAATFEVVRAMNILNGSYFDKPDLRSAIKNIHHSLRVGGLFVTGSNQDAGSTVDGAVYERVDDTFRRLWVSGAGSEVDEICVDLVL
jgi:chemotaxis methyl-accepting protein methylase